MAENFTKAKIITTLIFASSHQIPGNQISPDVTHADSYHRRFTTEGGRKESTLEIVVDWKLIRQKYWSAKVGVFQNIAVSSAGSTALCYLRD